MPRFPTYERQVGLSGGGTASYASDAIAAPARALQGLGGAVADVGSDFVAAAEKIQATKDDSWFSKARAQTTVDMANAQIEAQKASTEGGTGYMQSVNDNFTKYRDTKLAEAPSERAKQLYQTWSDSYGADLNVSSAKYQAEADLTKRTSDFTDAMNAHAKLIYSDPSQYEAVYKRAMDDLAGARQWMTPDQETAAREKITHDLQLARAKSLVEFSPRDFVSEVGTQAGQTGQAAIDATVNRIIGAESGGNPNAKNPNSSASGVGQFTNGTWLATVRKHRPDLGGLSDAELLRMKNDPKLGREMTVALTQDNARALNAAGQEANAGNLYLAHFAGIGGALAVLRSPDGASVDSVLGPEVTKANGFLNGKSVGWLKQWAAKKMGGPAPSNLSDPRFSGLSIDELQTLSGQAQRSIGAQDTADYAQLKGSMSLGIETGQVLSEQQILGSTLNDGDKATMLAKFRQGRGDQIEIADALGQLGAGSLSMDPYSDKDRKIVDGMMQTIMDKSDKPITGAAAEEIVRQTGIVPKQVMDMIRQGMDSQKVSDVAEAALAARRLSIIDPAALGRRDGGQKVADQATAFSHYVDTVGLTPEQAAQKLIDANDPAKAKERAAILESKPVKDFITNQATEAKVRDIFDPGVFGFDPKLGTNESQSAAMVGEYKDILTESLFDANGDQELAKKYAADRFQRRYGPSTFTMEGSDVVTRLPVEKTYPPGPDGTWNYIHDQVAAALAQEGVQADEIYLQPDAMTNRDVQSGKPARYQVWYKQGDKIEQFHLPFFAIPGDYSASITQSRVNRDNNIAVQHRTEKALEGSGMQNNPIMNGAVNPSPLFGGQ